MGKNRLSKMKFDRRNPWIIGIGVGIISGVLSGVLVGALFLHREKEIVRNLRLTHVKFADKCLKEGLDEEALRLYDDILEDLQEQDKYLYGYIRNQTARCYLCLAKRGIEKKRNLIRAAVAFEECLRASGSERWRESIFAELDLSGVYWSLSWFQDAEANIAKAVGFFEDVKELYPSLRSTAPFLLMGISPGDDFFIMETEFPTVEKDIKKAIKHGEETLKICTIEKYPVAYGLVQGSLGFYHSRLSYFEDKTANLDKAIGDFSEALKIFSSDKYPCNYIDLKTNISLAYMGLSDVNDEGRNLRSAFQMLKEALSVATLENHADRYAQIQLVLGNVYLNLSSIEDKEENIAKAIICCKNALKVCGSDGTTYEYGSVQAQLGELYLHFSKIKDKDINRKKSADSLKRAINAFEFCKQDRTTCDYKTVQERLGYLYLYLSELEDEDKNIKKFVDSLKRTLNVLDSEKYPLEYKRVSFMLKRAEKEKGQGKEEIK